MTAECCKHESRTREYFRHAAACYSHGMGPGGGGGLGVHAGESFEWVGSVARGGSPVQCGDVTSAGTPPLRQHRSGSFGAGGQYVLR